MLFAFQLPLVPSNMHGLFENFNVGGVSQRARWLACVAAFLRWCCSGLGCSALSVSAVGARPGHSSVITSRCENSISTACSLKFYHYIYLSITLPHIYRCPNSKVRPFFRNLKKHTEIFGIVCAVCFCQHVQTPNSDRSIPPLQTVV